MGVRGGAAAALAMVVVIFLSEGTRGGNATQHVVGGNQGWDVSADLSSWSSGTTFNVGDQLVFKYTAGLHSVVELGSESAYKNCNMGSGVKSMTGGNDVVKLTKTGTRYFACGTPGHCAQGMKLKINTLAAAASANNSSSSASVNNSSSSSVPTSTSSASTLQSSVYLVLTTLLASITITPLTVNVY